METIEKSEYWLGLMIGNSRLHWAEFQKERLLKTWETDHFSREEIIKNWQETYPLYFASVVPQQTELWQQVPQSTQLTLSHIPMADLYSSMGIDRALAALGAGETYGFPVLVIDAGTALTLTAINPERQLLGGAILPGLTMQFQSLQQKTAQLPALVLPSDLPSLWATDTTTAIESGILYVLLAGIKHFVEDWYAQYSQGAIALTGGDADILFKYIKTQYPSLAKKMIIDKNLIFWGMRSLLSDLSKGKY
ncbi:MAG: pantothenate kinase [Woronichinia naegeliana WA131]|jgi:type III pantothenate kinase|uniref:Type III pantothenate kinase n=1 Tax=Woronichinia naegeliana WA131 TaxID=2824559 RepID=A0A977PY05_9CYAN|nr:MAG: pantothenate kinase [Woronichinia naegeliana WA131]